MKTIKVLLVSPCHGSYGGIEAFVMAVADVLRHEPDFEVHICFKKTRGFQLQPDLAAMLPENSVIFVDRGGRQLIDAIKWADVVHLQNASPDVVFYAKLLRKRLALTIHNYMPKGWNLHRFLWRLSAHLADARWYNSEFVWRTWEGNRERRGSRKVPTVSKLPQGWTPPEQRRGFIFVGRWIANKGIETLINAYDQAKIDKEKWPLILMGDGPLRQSIESDLAKRDLTQVQVLGFVDEATKTERMKHARWIVVPPHTNEDFGLTAIEARNLGVPCIITRDGGLPEAGGRYALVCEPRDAEGLSRLLESAAQMSEQEYVDLAQRTRDDLKRELEPMSFYPQAYRHLVGSEQVT